MKNIISKELLSEALGVRLMGLRGVDVSAIAVCSELRMGEI